jgi:hypothetical protein
MAERDLEAASPEGESGEHIANTLVEMLPRDAIFSLRFLGESRVRLLEHFQAFIVGEFAKIGATPETHPMLHAFAETRAAALRDFVVAGVEFAHQFALEHMERLIGDSSGLLRVDIWDHLKSHIGDAQAQFQRQLGGLQTELEAYRAPPGRQP